MNSSTFAATVLQKVWVEKAILITTVYLDKHLFDWDFWVAKGFRLIFILIAIMRLVFV